MFERVILTFARQLQSEYALKQLFQKKDLLRHLKLSGDLADQVAEVLCN